MFYERLGFDVNIEQLRKDVEKYAFTAGEQFIQGKDYESKNYNGFGGWSILSRTGEWQDGWEVFHADDDDLKKILFNSEHTWKAMKYLGVSDAMEHKNETQVCQGEIKRVMDQLKFMGFYPRRARITCLKAGSKSLVHRDCGEERYMARIHIPIITNEDCVHISEGEHLHMPADGGVYMLWVNNWHQIRNDSKEDRYHIIMDAWDTKFLTKNFGFKGDINQLEKQAKHHRKMVDEAILTQQDIRFFDELKADFISKIPQKI